MQPPRLTAEQKEIEDALLNSATTTDPIFKYPKNGDHRSAFIFHDIDNDGQEEALVFYAASSTDYPRLSVIKQENGAWNGVFELRGAQSNVEFISFGHLTDPEQDDIIIGWSDTSGKRMELGVYTFLDGRLVNRLSGVQSYDTYLVADLDNSGLSELVVLTRDAATTEQASWIHLFSFDGYNIEKVSALPLSDAITKYAGITSGKLSPADARVGIFIDELLTGHTLATEVFVVSEGKLQPIINFTMVTPADIVITPAQLEKTEQELEEEADVEAPTLYDLTRRADTTSVCADVNGDGAVEIPTGRMLPGYSESTSDKDETERLYLTEFNRLNGNSFERLFSVAINRSAGYQVKFPPEWVDKVTIVALENNEWSFKEYNGLLENPLNDVSGEFLRIRVVSRKDYQDKFIENYTVLVTRGLFTYYAYLPETSAGPTEITMDQVKNELFSLI